MFKLNELSQEFKNKVVNLLDRDAFAGVLRPETVRVVVTGMALLTVIKRHNSPLTGLGQDSFEFGKLHVDEVRKERQENGEQYVALALEIYGERVAQDGLKVVAEMYGQAKADEIAAKHGFKIEPNGEIKDEKTGEPINWSARPQNDFVN